MIRYIGLGGVHRVHFPELGVRLVWLPGRGWHDEMDDPRQSDWVLTQLECDDSTLWAMLLDWIARATVEGQVPYADAVSMVSTRLRTALERRGEHYRRNAFTVRELKRLLRVWSQALQGSLQSEYPIWMQAHSRVAGCLTYRGTFDDFAHTDGHGYPCFHPNEALFVVDRLEWTADPFDDWEVYIPDEEAFATEEEAVNV